MSDLKNSDSFISVDRIPTSQKASPTIYWMVLTEQGNTMMLMSPEDSITWDGVIHDWQLIMFNLAVTDRVIREIRHRIMKLARALPFSEPDLNSIETAIGEAALNAVRHGSPQGNSNCINVRCERCDEELAVEITDEGKGFAPALVPDPVAEDLKSGGYGLYLMRGLMDEVEFLTHSEGGTTIRLVKRYSMQ